MIKKFKLLLDSVTQHSWKTAENCHRSNKEFRMFPLLRSSITIPASLRLCYWSIYSKHFSIVVQRELDGGSDCQGVIVNAGLFMGHCQGGQTIVPGEISWRQLSGGSCQGENYSGVSVKGAKVRGVNVLGEFHVRILRRGVIPWELPLNLTND